MGIFISYRRADAGGYSLLLYRSLCERYKKGDVFLDTVSGIPAGKYRPTITENVKNCTVLLPVIGSIWGTITDRFGKRRLEDEDDLLCEEIITAIREGKLLIPILINTAEMPAEEDLPDALKPLHDFQAFRLSDGSWDVDISKLFDELDKSFPGQSPALVADDTPTAIARAIQMERQNGASPFSSCDRGNQWQTVGEFAENQKQNLAIFLPGDVDQAHVLFLERLKKLRSGNQAVLFVQWDDYPQTRKELIEAIGKKFGSQTETDLVNELRRQLAVQHIWLLYSPVYLENHPVLIDYYTQWLPQLIQSIAPGQTSASNLHTIKCVQPVGWYMDSLSGCLSRADYNDLIRKIKDKSSPVFPIKELEELPNITKDDVLRWARAVGKRDPEAFAERMTHNAMNTAQIVQRIVR